MSKNMPILWQNCLLQFSTEIGRKAWVWFAETRGSGTQYDADKFATEVEGLVLALRPMLDASNRIGAESHGYSGSGEQMDDLMRFILTRHANLRLGGNVRPTYLN